MVTSRSSGQNGLAVLAFASLVDSSSGLFTRFLSTDGFTTAAGRGFFCFLFILAVLVLRDGRNVFRTLMGIGIWGLAFALINAGGMVMNILSLKLTAVANFFMIFAMAPFAAAIAGRLFLGETLDRATLIASLAGLAGIVIMMASGAKGGGLVGDLLALCVVLTYCGIVLIVRYHRIDTLPAIAVTTFLSTIFALPFARVAEVSTQDTAVLALFGFFQLGLGNLLIFRAVKLIPAAQAGLLGILSAAFAPLWVYVFLGEVPPAATLVGGGIILASAVLHLAWVMTRPRAAGVIADKAAA